MFTGLVQRTGELVSVERSPSGGHLKVHVGAWEPETVEVGDSIAVQGVCLTVTGLEGGVLSYDVLEETFNKTSLAGAKEGDRLNLERALCYGDAMGGHIVSGHVDGVGTVASILEKDGRDREVRVTCSAELVAHIVPKGSIACDGVSLTVVDVFPDGFTVRIIPHTWNNTSFSSYVEGTVVNLETDVLAKYAQAILAGKEQPDGISWETLSRLGNSS